MIQVRENSEVVIIYPDIFMIPIFLHPVIFLGPELGHWWFRPVSAANAQQGWLAILGLVNCGE